MTLLRAGEPLAAILGEPCVNAYLALKDTAYEALLRVSRSWERKHLRGTYDQNSTTLSPHISFSATRSITSDNNSVRALRFSRVSFAYVPVSADEPRYSLKVPDIQNRQRRRGAIDSPVRYLFAVAAASIATCQPTI
uniref:Uncharacterized protein n=1 Tax=Mycetohabitans sp. TaxID=2571162 RepID=A0A6B9HDS1_9BURK|nr:hypothetical protein [Mycetohabitans sp.]